MGTVSKNQMLLGGDLPFPIDNLRAFWSFGEQSGLTAFDSGPAGLDGTLTNASLWGGDAAKGGYIDYDGTNYISLGANPGGSLSLGNEFTLFAAFFTDDTSKFFAGLDLGYDSSSGDGYDGTFLQASSQIFARYQTGSMSLRTWNTGCTIEEGEINFIFFDRTNTEANAYRYSAGGEDSAQVTGSFGSFDHNTGNYGFIGAAASTQGVSSPTVITPSGIRGTIAGCWNAVLTEEERLAVVNNLKGNLP